MSTLIGSILAFVYLDGVWPWLIMLVLVAIDAIEIRIFLRTRRHRAHSGAEAIIGTTGRAITDCAPEGQVRVKGQIWKAWTSSHVPAGEEIVVTGVDGIRLRVAATDATSAER